MSETCITIARTLYDEAEANLKEVQSYVADAKDDIKRTKSHLLAVERSATAYAPRVVAGVKWLNKNARGWTNGLVSESDIGFTIKRIPSDSELQSLGFEPDPKIEKRSDIDGDQVLTVLWQTAQDIQQGKKSVTVQRLLKRAGVR
jgi:hypothetical protein